MKRSAVCLGVMLCLVGGFQPGTAGDFAIGVSPPYFELQGKPGEVVRDVMLLLNTANEFGDYQVRSADWTMNEKGGVTLFPPELVEGSCRPWVRIERRRLRLEPSARRNYRFEVHIPEDAREGECRFALLISPAEDDNPLADDNRDPNTIRMPISAQIAVIVYVGIGNASPRLEFQEAFLDDRGKGELPILKVRNSGTAHGRPFGAFQAVDAKGVRHELIVIPAPVLPDNVGEVPLVPDPTLPPDQVKPLEPPVTLEGTLEFGSERISIETRIE